MRTVLAVVCGALLTATGCQGMNHTQNGALLGSGLGAVTGAVIGSHNGHAGGGAAIGALAGGLGGALIGNAQDANEQRDAAIAHAQAAEQARQAEALALTNYDLIKMAQSGISDEVIIQSVRNRGGRFDLSPDALIALRQSGVSDQVILAVQKAGEPAAVVPAGGTTVVAGSPSQIVVVRPVPVRVGVGVVLGGPRRAVIHHHHGPSWGPRRRWHRHW